MVVEGYISTDPKDVKMEGPFGNTLVRLVD